MFVLLGFIPAYLLKPLDTLYSARVNSHKFWSLRAQCVCVLCLVLETNVIHLYVSKTKCVLCAVRVGSFKQK